MRASTRLIRGGAKVCFCLVGIAVGALLLARDYHPASAVVSTEIVPSASGTAADLTSSVVLVKDAAPGGISPCDPTETNAGTACLYVWAKNVNNFTGASAFQISATYDSNLINVDSMVKFTSWLGITGRSVACGPATIDEDPLTGSGHIFVECNTLNTPPPFGPNCPYYCTGLLAQITLRSQSVIGVTTLDFSQETYLVDTPTNPDLQQRIPATVHSVSIMVAPCADFTEDGQVLIEDVLHVVTMYYNPDPGPADLNGDGLALVDDIVLAVSEYYALCTA